MTSNPQAEELLPPAAADRSSGVRLTQTDEISIINRRGRSTHPQEKSVRRSGACAVNQPDPVEHLVTRESFRRGGRDHAEIGR
jgi:hypothetical protein